MDFGVSVLCRSAAEGEQQTRPFSDAHCCLTRALFALPNRMPRAEISGLTITLVLQGVQR